MSTNIPADSTLKKMSDSPLEVALGALDVRGHEVVDSTGQKIGKVNDLYVDENERRVRFLEVASGGFLGMGRDKILVPVDAVEPVGSETVRVSKDQQHLASGPEYDPELVDQDYLDRVYSYYGYPAYWQPTYVYPSRWAM